MSKMNTLTTEQIIEVLGLNTISKVDFSSLIIEQLRYGLSYGTVHANAVVETIRQIQGGGLKAQKRIRQFKHEPLKGFSYVHWFETRFIKNNIWNYWELDSPKSNKLIQMVQQTIKIPSGELKEIAYRIAHNVMEAFFERRGQNKLTGEWIIFYPREDKTFFLCLAQHRNGNDENQDKEIYLQIALACGDKYPELFPKKKTELLIEELIRQKHITTDGQTIKDNKNMDSSCKS